MILLKGLGDYEEAPAHVRESVNSYLDFSRRFVPFYRGALSGKEMDLRKYYQLPLTRDEDLYRDPLSFVASPERVVRATTSGGTSGKRKLVLRTGEDLERSISTVAGIFRGAGVKGGDRVAILQPFDMWNTGHIAMAAFERIGALSCPIGLSGTDDYILWLIEKLSCNVLFATPSRALRLAAAFGTRPKLKRVLCTGEPILEAHREVVRAAWGVEIFGTYGTEEVDGVAYECEAHSGYHIADGDLVVELLDPQTLLPAGKTSGLLVLSKLRRTGTVLLRYVVGDLVEVDESPCPCGSDLPRLRFLGRTTETLYLYDGLKVSLEPIEKAIASVLGRIPIYQVVIGGVGERDLLKVVVQQKGSDDLAENLRSAIASSTPDLEEAFLLDRTLDIRVVFDEDLSHFHFTRRGKMPRVVDRRDPSGRGKG